jgi:hypothetical protein
VRGDEGLGDLEADAAAQAASSEREIGHRQRVDAERARRRPLRTPVSYENAVSGSPVSSSVFKPLITIIQPVPETLSAVFGAPSS